MLRQSILELRDKQEQFVNFRSLRQLLQVLFEEIFTVGQGQFEIFCLRA
jgi:hypothetical protein